MLERWEVKEKCGKAGPWVARRAHLSWWRLARASAPLTGENCHVVAVINSDASESPAEMPVCFLYCLPRRESCLSVY